MIKSIVDTLVGLFIIVAAVFIVSDWYQRTKTPGSYDHYKLHAMFTDMTGLEIGSVVKISGIPVGYVSGYDLDANSYMADVAISIHNTVRVPVDSIASVSSEGIFGRKYFKISPGSQKIFYKENESIEFTQPPISLENIIGGLLFKNDGQ